MNTTSLFVELVVIGIGAGFWVALIIAAIFGCAWIPDGNMFSLIAAIPFLAVIYVLGIVSDRLIDKLFDFFRGTTIRSKYFKSSAEYYEARRKVIASSDRIADVIEYSRSRLRICRGWAVHSILIALAIPVFAFSQFPGDLAIKISTSGIVVFCVLGISSYYAWKFLNNMQYLKIKEQAEFLDKNLD
jgi:hypothetical protein